ncbi:hypothetical protein [Falsiroseomonas sp. HW251]|uniref:hypothetical protein n=1 Tax=Falsiroseomonas sp. HW251 TaxID=3390998 RepID=UPI003D31B6B7
MISKIAAAALVAATIVAQPVLAQGTGTTGSTTTIIVPNPTPGGVTPGSGPISGTGSTDSLGGSANSGAPLNAQGVPRVATPASPGVGAPAPSVSPSTTITGDTNSGGK